MFVHIVRRFIYLGVVLFIMSGIVFFLVHAVGGDPVALMMGGDAFQIENIEKIRAQLGLNRPLLVQYWDWLSHVVRGDLGQSFTQPMSTMELILQRLPVTFELSVLSLLFSLIVSVPLGILGAIKINSKIDVALLGWSAVCISMPNFLIGILLILFFSLKLNVLTATGYVSFFSFPLQNFKLMILPVLTLSIWPMAVFMRFTRSTLIETLRREYILVARAKGLLKKRVLWVHAFKNTLIPLVTVVGVNISGLFGGAVVTETVFSMPGLGRLLVDAILSRDLPLIQGIILFITTFVVLCNLVVDILYVYIDPKIRYD